MRKVPPEELQVARKLSRELDAYRAPSPEVQAARQLLEQDSDVRAGMRVRFWFVNDGDTVKDVKVCEIDYRQVSPLAGSGIRRGARKLAG